MANFIITPDYLTNVARSANFIKKLRILEEAKKISIEEIQPTLVGIAQMGRYCAEFDFTDIEDDIFLAIIEFLKEHGFTDIRPCENGKKVIEICWG
jgi:hypothetical protein